ncbi:hypothetical protein ZTR_08332 [Talaromyces verruculosus]|nr:hypothetical protein ZTR_08332 [Talaromyces verruculosus]
MHWPLEDRLKIQAWSVDHLFHSFTGKSNREEYFPSYIDTWNPYCEQQKFRSLMDFVVDITAAKSDFQPGLRELEAFVKNLPEDVDDGGFHAACLPPKPVSILETSTGPMAIDDLLPAAVSIDEMVEKPPAGWRLYKEMTTDHRYLYSGVPYKPYRKSGFAFWQAERMANLGFKDRQMWPDDDDDDDETGLRERYFVWRNILRGVDVSRRYGYRHVVTQ